MLDEPHDPPIDEDRLDSWLHGRCALFAVALHRLTGLPIRAWIDEESAIGEPVLVHAFVLEGDAALDAYGRRDPRGLLAEYEHWDPDLFAMTEAEVLAIGEGYEIDAAMMAKAMEDAAVVAAHLVPAAAGAPSP